MIALSYVMGMTGSIARLRECIKAVLIESACVHCVSSPMPTTYRDAVFKLCLCDGASGLTRAHSLSQLLQGDISQDVVDVYVPLGRAFDQEEWASAVALLLVPRRIRPFPRTRWCNSLMALSEVGLLAATHNLLDRAGRRWLGVDATQSTGLSSTLHSAVDRLVLDTAADRRKAWELSDSEEEGGRQVKGRVPDHFVGGPIGAPIGPPIGPL